MAADRFKEVSLGEIADFRNGKAIPPDRYSPQGKYPVFGSNGIIARTDDLLNSEAVAVIGRVGAYCGSVHYAPEESWVTDNAIIASPKADNDLRFLTYLLGSLQLQRTAIGSAQPLMTQGGLKVIRTKVPPLPEQKAIARILGTLDDKIELNRRMNATLEAMARALFQSWFVDFDPVHAKAAGRLAAGMDTAITTLFPATFQNSDLGEIPSGWNAPKLSEILTESNERIGKTHAPEYSSTNDGLQLRSERYTKTLAASSENNKAVRRGYLVFGLSRRVLNFGLMKDEIGSVSSAYKIYKVDERRCSADLLERYMRLNPAYYFKAISASSREGQSISNDSLGSLHYIQPPQQIQTAYYALSRPLFDRISQNEAQSRTLATLRDTLLPTLLSGELPVAEFEKEVERT